MFGIVLTHLGLLLLLLLVLLLILFLVFLVVLLLVILLVLVVLVLLVLLLLFVLLLLHMLAEHQIVTGLIVIRIITQGILVGLDSLVIHLVSLAYYSHIVIGSGLAQRIGLDACRLFKLLYCSRILLLRHQRIAQIICSLRILGILLYSLAIRYLSLIVLSQSELLITLADILAVGSLSMSGERKEERGKRNHS